MNDTLEQRIKDLEAENIILKHEFDSVRDTLEKTDKDEPSIGLLLCKDADTFVAQTTLKNTYSKIGISKYKFIEELPDYLQKRLKNR